MRRQHRETLRAQRNVRSIPATDFSEDEIIYETSEPFIRDILDAICAERQRYHVWCAKQYPTYEARRTGAAG